MSTGNFKKATKLYLALLGVVVLFALPKLALANGEIHGTVSTQLADGTPMFTVVKTEISLPDSRVELVNAKNNTVVVKTQTNTFGFFEITPQRSGLYALCASRSGFARSCTKPFRFRTQGPDYVPDHIFIQPSTAVLWGQVALTDGKPCYWNSLVFSEFFAAQVSLMDSADNDVVKSVIVNDSGYYVLAGMTGEGQYRLHAQCEKAEVDFKSVMQFGNPSNVARHDLIVQNASPILSDVDVTSAGVRMRNFTGNATTDVAAISTHPQGLPIDTAWRTSTLTVMPAGANSNVTLAAAGPQTIYTRVRDFAGGVATGKIDVKINQPTQLFQGTVRDRQSGKPVSNAQINLFDKKVAVTDVEGVFKFEQTAGNEFGTTGDRFALNVHAQGFAFVSRIIYAPSASIVIAMDAVEQTKIDPARGGIVETAPNHSELRARVKFEAESFVDEEGNKPTGNVHVNLHNFDLKSDDPIPGDLSGVDMNGKDVRLESFGSIDVAMTDDAGRKIELKSGSAAEVQIPVAPDLQASAKPTIPFFTFDEATGLWKQESDAILQGNSYVAKVGHFTAFNADTIFSDSACIKINVDEANAPAYPFVLHVSIPTAAGPVRHNDFVVTEKINGIFRLPENVLTTFDVFPGSGPGATTKIATLPAVSSGARINNSFNGFPPFPFTACNGQITISLPLPGHTSDYLSRFKDLRTATAGSLFAAEPAQYYNAIGATSGGTPTVTRGNFAAWKTFHGFSANANTPVASEIRAIYYNDGDLQFGRDMHCKKSASNAAISACYVTNYTANGSPGGDPNVALDNAINHPGTDVATVAMENDPSLGANAVSFFVFDKASTGGALLPAAALDTQGPKFMPRLCTACHYGDFQASNKKVSGARFLPFDVSSFKYDQVNGYTLSNQQEAFRTLNEFVKNTAPTAPANDAVNNLIDAWYAGCGGVSAAGCQANNAALPALWAGLGHDSLYLDVIKPVCRGCHITQPSFRDWNSATGTIALKSSIQFRTCPPAFADDHSMPHAEVPLKRMWFSGNPHIPFALADATSGLGLTGTSCNP
jgi:hypothetical protein